MRRHLHTWTEETRVYTEPPSRGFEVDRIAPQLFREIMFGVTSICLRCDACGDVKESLLVGDHRAPIR